MVRRVGLLLAFVATLATAPAASRADDANRACDDGQGVTIVVDFGSLGGGVNVRCAPQPIKNGFDVFRNAHVSYDTVSGSDFVCRIAGLPGPEAEDCVNTPPPNAYWSYWYAKPGGDWKYSNQGPGARKPPAGSFEGWAFKSADNAQPPRYQVPAAPATTTTAPSPTPDATPTTAPSGAVAPTPTRAPVDARAATTTSAPTSTTAAAPSELGAGLQETTTTVQLGHVDLSVGSNDGGTSKGFIVSVVSLGGMAAIAFAFLRRRAR